MTTTPDITIIGGGIIGLLTAREFFKAGATVTLLKKMSWARNHPGQAAVFCCRFILGDKPDAITRLALQSLKLYPALASQLTTETQIDPEWNPCGLLITKNPDIAAAVNWCNANNISYRPAGADFFNTA